jgi:hypothetical protein
VHHFLVMSDPARDGPPTEWVLDAFGVRGTAVLLSGGQGTSWRVGSAVFKPTDTGPATLAWYETVLRQLDGRSDFRVSPPLRSSSGELVVDGWTAWRYEAAESLKPTDARSQLIHGDLTGNVLFFRAVTDHLAGRMDAADPYLPAFELALRLAGQ